ncbi:hypothetical protein CC80DRAFT_461911 [Byssothecium circinans]|uniref:C2H2-type domain-containing protein n=1 Tax=Byssothecium circinans TaxID=147558 RepID=A0A6A5UA57_9PLEO|nr:hypothetical protein CC80DRAFT_461911 [Byssothecium circinans]
MECPTEPPNRIKCTYKDCDMSFTSMRSMLSHKKNSEFHDYCEKCDEDFDSYDDLAQHKAFRPDKHHKACRVCGEEFKSTSGLRRHIELTHKVDQKLKCLGCEDTFYRASLMVEHLEYGHCTVISPEQFMGHIVHKHLVTELLKGGPSYDRFMQKISNFEAANDHEHQGGVSVASDDMMEPDEEDEARDVPFEAIKPVILNEDVVHPGHYPPLPSQSGKKGSETAVDLSSALDNMSISGASSTTAVGAGGSDADGVDAEGSNKTGRQVTAWVPGSSKQLFPKAHATPPPSEYSINRYDDEMNKDHGINILKTRFWDPLSGDWNPDRFFNSIISKYFCPFPCEQVFDNANEMNMHIMTEHRIKRMKCPSCLKYYKTVTALMSHCESRGSRCSINKADNFNIFLDKITGGFLSVEEKTRPDHLHNPTVWVKNTETDSIEQYTPPTANYLQYTSSKPVDWKDPKKVAAQIGGGGNAFKYQGQLSRW